jgi:flagellar basal body-associated protein FliL
MSWVAIIIVGILALALIVFLVFWNLKDEKEFEKELDNDYPKPLAEEGEIETDELTRDVH